VLACTLAKSIFRGFRWFFGASLTAVTVVALSASALNADAYVARANLERSMRGAPLDEEYLQSLTADACAALDHPALRDDPLLRDRLSSGWILKETTGEWRGFRGLGRCPR
jgi:hypothetical protein